MRRREFVAFVGVAAARPFLARAQQPAVPVIGFLNPSTSDFYPQAMSAFHSGLRESGFVEGENVAIVYRWADGRSERLPALAAELVGRQVAVIAATGGGRSALAAKAATSTIPIVFNSADDPVQMGLVASLSRPGGNLTGVSRLSAELMPRRLELLRDVVPEASPIVYLMDLDTASIGGSAASAYEAARVLGVELHVVKISPTEKLETAFAGLARTEPKALLIAPSSYFNTHSQQIGQLTVHHKIPAIYQLREFAAAGGLMSYGASLTHAYNTVGLYTGRVLKGTQPADLPVQQQTRLDFIINLRTAKTLGLSLPNSLVARADEVIE